MDNRPIGFFDSGLGGLTSVTDLKRKYPDETVIYYGDTARTPYGSKSPDTIREFASQVVGYLVKQDVKMVVIACNTVTAMALDHLRTEWPDVPIIGVIGPTAQKIASEGIKNVGIIGTKVTISSNVYADSITDLDESIRTYSLACPAIVPLIEEGIVDDEIMDMLIKRYMDDFVSENDFSDLVLGCTHYPLIAANIKRIYPQLRLHSSSSEVINEAGRLMKENDILASDHAGTDRYYASDLSENFIRMTELLLGETNPKIELKRLED